MSWDTRCPTEAPRNEMSERILFIGYCWGAAGTTWLSRLLNAHQDILCMHSPNFPRYDNSSFEDCLEIIDAVFNGWNFGLAYPIVGFTHGISLEWHARLSQRYSPAFRCFILTRHPIKRIESTVALNIIQKERRLSTPGWRAACADAYDDLARRQRKRPPDDFESLAFYAACKMVNSITVEVQHAFPLYKLEEILNDCGTVNRLVGHISNGTCQLFDPTIETLQQTVVRARSAVGRSPEGTYLSWRAEHRDAYRELVTPDAFEAYRHLGYEFPHAI